MATRTSRSCHQRSRSGVGRVGIEQGRVRDRGSAADRESAVDRPKPRRIGYQITVEQRQRVQPAREVQLRQRPGQRELGRQPDAGLQRGRHDTREPGRLGHPQRARHPAQRRALEHRDVRSTGDGDPQGVVGAADRLVRGDPHVHPPPDGRQLVDRAAGLLDVLQTARSPVERADGRDGRVDVPGPVGVDPHRTAGAQRVADRLHPGDVVGE